MYIIVKYKITIVKIEVKNYTTEKLTNISNNLHKILKIKL